MQCLLQLLFSGLAPDVFRGNCIKPCTKCTQKQIRKVIVLLQQNFPREFSAVLHKFRQGRSGWFFIYFCFSTMEPMSFWSFLNATSTWILTTIFLFVLYCTYYIFVSIILNTKHFIYCMEVLIWWLQYCKIHANSWQKVFGKLQNSLFLILR